MVDELKPKEIIENEIEDYIQNYYETYSKILSPYKKKTLVWHNLYRCIPVRGSYKGLANTFPPESFCALETLVADIMSIIYGEEPFFAGEPQPPETEETAKLMERLMWQLMLEMGFKRKFLSFIRRLGIEGTVPAVAFWNKEEREVKDKVKETRFVRSFLRPFGKEQTVVVEKRIKKLTKNYFDFNTPALLDSFFDPFAEISESPCMFRYKVEWGELIRLEKEGRLKRKQIDLIRDKKNVEMAKEEKNLKQKKQRSAGFVVPDTNKIKDEYELFQWFGEAKKSWLKWGGEEDFEFSEETEDEKVEVEILYSNGKLLGITENDYWDAEKPVVLGQWLELDGETFSISSLSINEKSQLELNDTRNQELDHKTFALYHIWVKSREAQINNNDLVITPNQIIEVEGDVNRALREVRPDPAAFQTGIVMESVIKDDIRRAAGATSPRQGVRASPTARVTATESQSLMSRGGMRATLIAMTIAETFLKPLLKKFWYLMKQNIRNPIDLIGKDGVKIMPDQIIGEFKWHPKILTDPLNRLTMRQYLIMMMEGLGRIPQMAGQGIYNLARKLYQSFNFKDVDVVFPPVPTEQWRSMSPEDENKIMLQGKVVKANQWHDHVAHLESHVNERQKQKENETIAKVFDMHINEHFEYTGALQKLIVQPGGQGATQRQ